RSCPVLRRTSWPIVAKVAGGTKLFLQVPEVATGDDAVAADPGRWLKQTALVQPLDLPQLNAQRLGGLPQRQERDHDLHGPPPVPSSTGACRCGSLPAYAVRG